jgi:hypothetical protein
VLGLLLKNSALPVCATDISDAEMVQEQPKAQPEGNSKLCILPKPLCIIYTRKYNLDHNGRMKH